MESAEMVEVDQRLDVCDHCVMTGPVENKDMSLPRAAELVWFSWDGTRGSRLVCEISSDI